MDSLLPFLPKVQSGYDYTKGKARGLIILPLTDMFEKIVGGLRTDVHITHVKEHDLLTRHTRNGIQQLGHVTREMEEELVDHLILERVQAFCFFGFIMLNRIKGREEEVVV